MMTGSEMYIVKIVYLKSHTERERERRGEGERAKRKREISVPG